MWLIAITAQQVSLQSKWKTKLKTLSSHWDQSAAYLSDSSVVPVLPVTFPSHAWTQAEEEEEGGVDLGGGVMQTEQKKHENNNNEHLGQWQAVKKTGASILDIFSF